MITLSLLTADGRTLAVARHEEEALLCYDRVYEPGDVLTVESDARHLLVQPAAGLPPAQVYAPSGRMTWAVPVGEHRLAYAPGTFDGTRHIARARALTDAEIAAPRNVALNPADLRGDVDFFPHCTANVETRGESCFAARNVIDGMRYNTFHGEWPYQSWGIGAREDAWCRIDFGREVDVTAMALTLRADFPHDAYWTHGTVELSDGAEISFNLRRTGDRQTVPLGKHRVRWMRLIRMIKSDDPSAFPALTEWEVYGRDAVNEGR